MANSVDPDQTAPIEFHYDVKLVVLRFFTFQRTELKIQVSGSMLK